MASHDSTIVEQVARPPEGDAESVSFGPFQLLWSRQLLLRDGQPVRLGSRAIALLIALIEGRGELVGKDTLMRRVWPNTYVEEANLRVHMSALRRALGDVSDPPQYILNVSGRGYRFIPEVTRQSSVAKQDRWQARPILPAEVEVLGRDDDIATVTDRLIARRFVTVAGPGGMGKSTVARSVASKISSRFRDGVVFVDFSAASDAASALANVLKLSVPQDDPVPALIDFVRSLNLLFVLDSCEHVVGDLAVLAEKVMREAPDVYLLATSIEPIRAAGEWIYRLPALDIPAEAENLSARDVRTSSAVALFVSRARARSDSFDLTDEQVPYVVEICRRLDGNPLAIELAAARVDVFSVADLARHLDHRFDLLAGERRTGAPRHQTLRQLLDWSHEHLSSDEQTALRRLSVFRGEFSMEAAEWIVDLGQKAVPGSVVRDLAGLVRKSLVLARTSNGRTSYRLLDSTRAYSSEKAIEAGEEHAVRTAHALFLETLMRRAEEEWHSLATAQWLESYSSLVDDIRAALDWTFSPKGDGALGLRLTALALPMALQRGLVDEMRGWMDRAIALAETVVPREYAAEIRIHTTHATLAQNQKAVFGSQARGFLQALRIADLSRDRRLRVEPLIGYAAFNLGLGAYREALRHAEEASEIAEDWGDDFAHLGAHRVLAQAAAFTGQIERGHAIANWVVMHRAKKVPWAFGAIAVDRAVSMRIVMARSLWLMGRPVDATNVAAEAVERAGEDSPLAVCQALALAACPISLWRGDTQAARALADRLLLEARRFTLEHWHTWGLLFDGVLRRREGGNTGPSPVPRGSLQADTLVTFDATTVSPELAERAGLEDGWCEPEITRAAALTMKPRQALATLEKALARARGMKAIAWQLRIATDIAELEPSRDRGGAKAILAPIVDQFVEGLDDVDVRRGRDVLDRV